MCIEARLPASAVGSITGFGYGSPILTNILPRMDGPEQAATNYNFVAQTQQKGCLSFTTSVAECPPR